MRLIDRAALRELLEKRVVTLQIADTGSERFKGEFRAMTWVLLKLNAAPTVSCEECEHAWDGVYDKSIVHCRLDRTARGRDWFCGDFQRRQP